MSKAETIAKLESLLSRIRSRAAEPRPVRTSPANGPVAAAAPAPEPAFDDVELETIPPPASVAPVLPPPAPPPPAPPAPPPVLAAEADASVEVEMLPEAAIETVIGVTTEEVMVEALDSRERLVAAEPIVGIAIERAAPEPSEESPPEILAAVEEVEEAPLSSRRPVAPQPEERLAEMAFGAEEPRPPHHTPPPESGRLPAVPEREFDRDVTGVREAPSRPHELVAEATHAQLAPSDAVADIVGHAQRFAPQTFVALLDASLAL